MNNFFMGKKSKSNQDSGICASSKKGKMSLEFKLNSHITNDKFIEEIKELWSNRGSSKESTSSDNFLFVNDPFPCCQLQNAVFEHSNNIDNLIEEVHALDYKEKNNDLYKFIQSMDLNGIKESIYIDALKNLLYGPLLSWMKDITGIELSEAHIDMFAAQYKFSDYLLCHDDELEGRRIAFIWYLVPSDWNEKDGGALDLYDRDENSGEPRRVINSLIPLRNSFSFFEVSHLSFHQVAEILSKDKTRLAITGWFRGKSLQGPPKAPCPLLERLSPLEMDENEFYNWINPSFLSPVTQGDIQETFEDKSEISLSNFLLPEKFNEVKNALLKSELSWKSIGPPNRRSYDILSTESAPEILKSFLMFLRSDAFFLFLSNVTGIKLHPLYEGDEEDDEQEEDSKSKEEKCCSPTCSYELRRWKAGSYTLIRDGDKREQCLDVRLCFNVGSLSSHWDDEVGGFTSYIAKDEDEELISISPEDNTLFLVYKDDETLKFVKYLNAKYQGSAFYDIECSYYE
uniref:2oxoglutarate and irondependent oxygenase domain containing 1 [Otolemur garnettii] n=1 Tax=Lepeophtheirus salmonis TaxID=72036 RepID=A0A0K2V3K4_LEPSM